MLCMRRCTNTLAKIVQPDHSIRRQNTDDPRREQLDTLQSTRGSTRANERPLSAPTRPAETGVDRCVRLSRTLLELSSRKCHTCTIMYHMSDSGDVTFINSVVVRRAIHATRNLVRNAFRAPITYMRVFDSPECMYVLFSRMLTRVRYSSLALTLYTYVGTSNGNTVSSIDVRDLDG